MDYSVYALEAVFDGDLEIHGVSVECVVHIKVPLSVDDEWIKVEADIESAGFYFGASGHDVPFLHLPAPFLDSYPSRDNAGSYACLATWRELVHTAALHEVEKANSWQRVDTRED